MYTTVLFIALVTTPTADSALEWQRSYGAALQVARSENRPVAVFVGSGDNGWKSVLAGGKMSEGVRELLKERYVPVYVNLATANGKRLAEAFEVTGGSALVLSTRGGAEQAFRHEGELLESDLEKTLTRYSSRDQTVTSTERLGTTQTRLAYSPAPGLSLGLGSVVPAPSVAAPSLGTVYPAVGYAPAPGGTNAFSGSAAVLSVTGYNPGFSGSYGAPNSAPPSYAAPSYAAPSGYAAPSYTTGYSLAPSAGYAAPAYSGGYNIGSFGGGCPGGRCR